MKVQIRQQLPAAEVFTVFTGWIVKIPEQQLLTIACSYTV